MPTSTPASRKRRQTASTSSGRRPGDLLGAHPDQVVVGDAEQLARRGVGVHVAAVVVGDDDRHVAPGRSGSARSLRRPDHSDDLTSRSGRHPRARALTARGYGPSMLGSGLIGGSLRHGQGDGGRRRPLARPARPRQRHAPDDWLDARDPEYIRDALPAIRAWSDLYFRAEVEGLERDPRRRAGAAGRQPLRRHADRRHVRLRPALLRPLRRRAALPPARPRPRLPGARRAREPEPLRHRARQPGQHARRAGPRRRAARLPGRRPRDLPAELGAGPDRLRGAHGLRQARARARHPDRARRGDRRPGDGAVPRPGPADLARAAARPGAAAEGVPGPGRAAVRPDAARPAAAVPAAVEDHDPACSRGSTCARSSARTPTPRTPTSSSRSRMQDELSELADERTLPVVG